MTFSAKSWEKIQGIYSRILEHPFIAGLIEGTLPKEKFIYYINQDALYLADFGRALAIIAGKLEKPEHIDSFLSFSKDTMYVEKALHQSFLSGGVPAFLSGDVPAFLSGGVSAFSQDGVTPGKSPACQLYTSYILGLLAVEPVEICVAAVLPCFWIYKEVGDFIISQKPSADNPYKSWIDTYGGEEYANAVRKAVAIYDELASAVSEDQRRKMTEAFVLCSKMEWMFWDSAYKLEKWPV